MPHRAPSPAQSENDLDITGALFNGSTLSDDESGPRAKKNNGNSEHELDIDTIADVEPDFDDSGDDASFIAATQAASNRKSSNLKGKTVKKGGGFQAMGLNALLLKAITRKGFSVPTPIQRKTIPLVIDGQDVVGMARTGSGKTAAFVIPMIQKLKSHSAKVGARAVIMSPSRELALQTLKVVKELGRGTDLRTVLLVGGDSLEDQFSAMTSTNPDVIIATPGRFLHLKVEMQLELSSIQYVVFDEADRLFEMGFAAQLGEILAALPASRQTLLFSATLPSSLVEFARAGLQEPKLIRLDAESKVSPDLQSAFFTIKSAEKEGALLYILRDVINMPIGETEATQKLKGKQQPPDSGSKKRKRGKDLPVANATDSPTPHSTIIFTATKHHVEYLAALLRASGYSVSYVYGSLDQTARKQQVESFRAGFSNILVVTDVAARGIDIPVLANVINYDFTSQAKIFVHRVGRTARAGKTGWSYSLVRDADVPYLLDLQLFLSRKLVLGRTESRPSFAEDVVVGCLPRNGLEQCVEEGTKLLDEDEDLTALRSVAAKGEKLYNRTRNSASVESAKRSKEILSSPKIAELNMLFASKEAEEGGAERQREEMLKRVSGFRPQETVFEIGKRGNGEVAAQIMQARRKRIEMKKKQAADRGVGEMPTVETDEPIDEHNDENTSDAFDDELESAADSEQEDFNMQDDDDELEVTISEAPSKRAKHDSSDANTFQDTEHFMSYLPASNNFVSDRAYGVSSGSNEKSSTSFVTAARNASMNLAQDEATAFAEPSRMRWDKRSKKYVARANDDDGSRGKKMVKGESGMKIAASLRSGRFDAWRKANKVRQPRIGEAEGTASAGDARSVGGKRFKHKAERAPKEADKWRDDYYKQKKKVTEAKEKRIGKFRDGVGARSELKSVDDVRKERNLKEKKMAKNARPSRKRKI
ncbi:ATP-dependent RNA helicase dbp10 [Rhizodiscina lignyota]|uniref:RNA helicase n=1 Tax=Rhizodiscina lignyota TaxID=1504668 RepID=A0A9P4I7J0_9PEZI|nr:ATP-dependent RNA helicase dbp10 [Rhizodiscina lignyota]